MSFLSSFLLIRHWQTRSILSIWAIFVVFWRQKCEKFSPNGEELLSLPVALSQIDFSDLEKSFSLVETSSKQIKTPFLWAPKWSIWNLPEFIYIRLGRNANAGNFWMTHAYSDTRRIKEGVALTPFSTFSLDDVVEQHLYIFDWDRKLKKNGGKKSNGLFIT